jgi:hypothetical protein
LALSAPRKIHATETFGRPDHDPGAQNRQIFDALNLSKSGLKRLKRDLIRKHVLISCDTGFTVRLPGLILIRDGEGSHFVPESGAAKTGYKMDLPAPRLTPPSDLLKIWTEEMNDITKRPCEYPPWHPVSLTAGMVKRVEIECAEGPERDRVLATMKEAGDRIFARNFVLESAHKLLAIVDSATPAQLAAVREKAEGLMLSGRAEPKLLGMFTTAISQQPNPEGKHCKMSLRILLLTSQVVRQAPLPPAHGCYRQFYASSSTGSSSTRRKPC